MELFPGTLGAPSTASTFYPIFSESGLHPSLAPNPDSGQARDDDVDALDVCMSGNCTMWYFSADHEATGNLAGFGPLNPGAIYEASPLGGFPALVVDPQIHLGLPPGTDIDAFEFVWLSPCDFCGPALALIFSVAGDDYLTTAVNESGGLDPLNQLLTVAPGHTGGVLLNAPCRAAHRRDSLG